MPFTKILDLKTKNSTTYCSWKNSRHSVPRLEVINERERTAVALCSEINSIGGIISLWLISLLRSSRLFPFLSDIHFIQEKLKEFVVRSSWNLPAEKVFLYSHLVLLYNVFELQGEFACSSLQNIEITLIKEALLSEATLKITSWYQKELQYLQRNFLTNNCFMECNLSR